MGHTGNMVCGYVGDVGIAEAFLLFSAALQVLILGLLLYKFHAF